MQSRNRHFFILLIASPLSTYAGSHIDDYRVACTQSQEQVIKVAVAKAKSMLVDVNQSLPPLNSTIGAKFQKWFGGANGDYDPKVKEVYTNASALLNFNKYWCPNISFPNDDAGTYAWVPSDSANEIFFESLFFQAGTSGADSQAGTIIHEVCHGSTVASVVDSDVTGDGDADYGVDNAKQLASTNPQLARRTADNLQYFAEDLVFGIN